MSARRVVAIAVLFAAGACATASDRQAPGDEYQRVRDAYAAGLHGGGFDDAEAARTIEADVVAVMAAQLEAWNAGDIGGFMAGYWEDEAVRFASGGEATTGWLATLKRYRERYPDPAAMGFLSFEDIDVTVLAPDAAVVFGAWALDCETDPVSGLFTLVFRKKEGRWVIVHDHTSAAE